jgi:hypothetical protein
MLFFQEIQSFFFRSIHESYSKNFLSLIYPFQSLSDHTHEEYIRFLHTS